MATLFLLNGRWKIDVYRQGRLHLGKNKSHASEVYRHVQHLEQCVKYATSPHPKTIAWASRIDAKLRDRLVKFELLDNAAASTIGELCERFVRLKNSEHCVYTHTVANMIRYFGADLPISKVTKADAQEFKAWLFVHGRKHSSRPLAEPTVAKRVKTARAIFKLAVDSRQLETNPFTGLKVGSMANPDRARYIAPDISQQIVDGVEDPEIRLVFAFARWAGFRIPSEVVRLRWSDVSFDRGSIRILESKTKTRVCPLFPEIRRIVNQPGNDDDLVFPKGLPNLRNRFLAELNRLEIEPWPRLFQNLRATRATEVDAEFGRKAESEWIGHGSDVALQHYLTVTDSTWARAVGADNLARTTI